MLKKPEPRPDFVELERRIAEFWEREEIPAKYLKKNEKSTEQFSFFDGPITANNPMGVHHAWGRSLKDLYQRYQTMKGKRQRYQNGFDSQGLWVEVEVEKSLGLNSKREIEEYGIAEFTERCKERVAEYAAVITDQSKRLGMWMDWGNDYYTFSDTNIGYIWGFLKEVESRGWLYQGPRATEWCPRCGTSLSQHEQTDSYREMVHPSVFVRFPLKDRPGESLAVWTTTPWTLPANVAAAVKPDAAYVLLDSGEYVAAERLSALPLMPEIKKTLKGKELVGLTYLGPFDDLPAQEGIEHRVIEWSDVTLEEGTGIVHIAPGCGAEDFELGKKYELPALAPLDEAGRLLEPYGPFAGQTTDEVRDPIIEALREKNLLIEAGEVAHRYPVCWRCTTPLVFRIVEDWYISAQEIRQPMLDANAGVIWEPAFYKKRMDDWLRNMGDWNISRKRYFGLPLPFYPCNNCGKFNVIGSRTELEERATTGLDQLQELHRPWIDEVLIDCAHCSAKGLKRIPEVGDAWLDAGIIAFSTLGWQNPTTIPHGYATGAAAAVSEADLPDHAYWEQWFPADFVTEMREQIRLWFYSLSFMSITLTGKSPYKRVLTYEKLRDEAGREMHKSWGNAIEFNEAAERMGADVMRWMYARHNPELNINFGYALAEELKRRVFLTLWNSYIYFTTYAGPDFTPDPEFMPTHALDRWLVETVDYASAEVDRALGETKTQAATQSIELLIDDLSTWYIRRSRPRFAPGADPSDRRAAEQTLYRALVRLSQLLAPFTPFLAEELYQGLVPSVDPTAPPSVHLSDFPEGDRGLSDLTREMAELRQVVSLAHAARSSAGIKVRQPLAAVKISDQKAFSAELESLLLDELNVRSVTYEGGDTLIVELDTDLTPELRLEGEYRELIRMIQNQRREKGLEVSQKVATTISGPEPLVEYLKSRSQDLQAEVRASEVAFKIEGEGLKVELGDPR